MKISREAWDLKEECFGPLLPYVKDQQVTTFKIWDSKSSGESDTGVRRPI